ncbi:D-Ala-D-Ala carboxypeptidase family metallohydrolase [Aneurinibacillus thermoaerophilus]|uniref:Peptidase M15 n=1 Tax=Aneurinibacillus thermoaerophilus TaxID=143495 RepID=A0A1G8EPA0_ANETH|nr:D-Ala-D-Ala carboxypeptidase family metallohydrolase [Aneurinibacillus thermoaerophilus]MED0758672.1 D-Ala-D-Ala carboxypeptidase family metallohydrolase [Aneurinibacillus thermoaerophilus]MED0761062.1 D-Ala-D-Ala carboxypeptidase family metallohydrolase [Aneurinibacillus thermoaerophilus]SDH71549.1 Peptidase M15 [Aneurinibacillus thermoaerophilus]
MENPISIFLSINNGEKTMQLPVLPSELEIPQATMANETFQTVNGEIRLIGTRTLRKITLTAFFPDNPYSFDKTGLAGFEAWGGTGQAARKHVEELKRWIERRVPIRLRVPYYDINMAVTIDSFTPKVKDGSRDIYYTLEMTEFVFPQLKVQKATGRVKPTVPKFEKYVPPPKDDSKSKASSNKSRPGKGYDSPQAKAVRDKVKKLGLRISSAGRSARHNAEVGGAKNSAHLTNEAYDVVGNSKKLDELAAWGRANGYYVLWRTKGHYDHVHIDWKKR